jgi:uncharacterized protein YxjI
MLSVRINSRLFSSGFDISTPLENYSAKKVSLFPTGEILISNSSEKQIARVGRKSFLSDVYNIIITGGGFYQFDRDNLTRKTWTCKGEGKLLCISERSRRRFLISEEDQVVAECSKAWFTSDYAIKVFNDAEWKLVVCIFIALSVREHDSGDIPA